MSSNFIQLCLFRISKRAINIVYVHSGLNLNIQVQKLIFRFNSIQMPIIQYLGFIQNVIAWQVLAGANASESHQLVNGMYNSDSFSSRRRQVIVIKAI